MITIDTTQSSVGLILTLAEKTTVESPDYKLVLYSPFTKKNYRVELGVNTSSFTFRYDEFILDSEIFKSMEEGVYFYSIYQTSVEENPIEVGLLKIKGEVEEYVSITPDETEDDFITYDPD